MRMSIRTLINIRILLSVILILIFSAIVAVWQARNSVEKEVNSSINLAVQMIEFAFNQDPSSTEGNDIWLEKVAAMQSVRHLHISIKDNKGEQKNNNKLYMSDEKNMAPRWFIKAIGIEFFTHHYNINIENGTTKTIFITANPMDEISEAWGETKAYFLSIVLMLFIIFFTINLVFHSMLKAVKAILSGLCQIEEGKFDHVLPRFKMSEFDAIAAEINTMSMALKTAQQNNQSLARHTMKIQETERQNMSRELHDEMGQSLTAIKAMAVTCQQAGTDVKKVTSAIVDICDHVSVVLRSMMKTLHPLSLAELGLGATLSELVREWQRRSHDLKFNLNYDDTLDKLSHEITIHVYRIVQECLTNAVRHANASEVVISVTKREQEVWINVSDNGQGKQNNNSGFGLLSMRERAESLGGKFTLKFIKNSGFKVMVQLPYRENK